MREVDWPNDHIIRCKSPCDLLEFFERDMDIEEEFEEFERMKLLKCISSINKLMIILEFFSNIVYNVFIVNKRNQINIF